MAIRERPAIFGFTASALVPELFLKENEIVRFGAPPLRVEIHTTLSGVDFADCYIRRDERIVDETPTPFIGLSDLRINKRASGRGKDQVDLDSLPE